MNMESPHRELEVEGLSVPDPRGLERSRRAPWGPLPRAWQLIHAFIILNLVVQMGYIGWQVFVVLQPEGVSGPMFSAALDVPHELMVTRRMYAAEGWYAAIGLALYLAVTEILPRRLHRG